MSKYEKIRDICIYKLEARNPTILPFYIGSTCDLYMRTAAHKHACKDEKSKKHNYYLYQFIRDFGGFNAWRVVPLWKGKGTLKDKIEMEKKFFEMYKPQLNKVVIGRTVKQYQEDKKEDIRIKNRTYRLNNIEKHRKQLRESYYKNKEKRAKYNAEYYKKNKAKISQRVKGNHYCICGCVVPNRLRLKHRETKEHKEKLKCAFNNNVLFNYQLQQTTGRKTRGKIRTLKKKKQKN